MEVAMVEADLKSM